LALSHILQSVIIAVELCSVCVAPSVLSCCCFCW